MSWNYRIVKHLDPDGTESFHIHEAFYDEGSDVPNSITTTPCHAMSETAEGVRDDLELMMRACDKPVLNDRDFGRAGPVKRSKIKRRKSLGMEG